MSELARLVSHIRDLVNMIPRSGKRYMFELAKQLKEVRRFKPLIVAGYNACILALLDEAMVNYDEVHEIIPPYQAIILDGWRAERVLETVDWTEGAKDMYFLATCLIDDRCIYHLYDISSEEELTATAAYLAMIIIIDDLAHEALTRRLCREHDDCLGYVVSRMKALAPTHRPIPTLLDHLARISKPHEIYCTRDILQEHKH